ncbi:zf-HC2 domain-containing protein [Paenisporosarcina sp. OV554]|uniref:zf-HC2 domain-containing protein n=1 Tax=Paenisporosarcina sp. OV554 TaxID=2135694 RepID=UPI000D3524C7|nr:zf-HC2 domain-containing protein [Paenisporosarcina sp. OV554]PUB11130.1 putative zinc finger protein [Paenisporosarcina sp. OV554]
MSKVSCEIVKDMLPLYYDNVCSDDSKRMVEEHLVECDSCKMELDRIQADFKLPKEEIERNNNDGNVIKNISSFWNRSRAKSFIKGGIISALLLSLITLGYFGLFHWHITNVPIDVVEIKDVSEMSDGKIVYYSEINDGYSLNRLKYDMDKEGNFYITPLRPMIKQKAQSLNVLEKGYEFIDIKEQEIFRGEEIKTINYGTPKEKILIWKKGMELPKASEEIENMFDFN